MLEYDAMIELYTLLDLCCRIFMRENGTVPLK